MKMPCLVVPIVLMMSLGACDGSVSTTALPDKDAHEQSDAGHAEPGHGGGESVALSPEQIATAGIMIL